VAHSLYRSLDLPMLKRVLQTPLLIDGRHLFDAEVAQSAGLIYRCVGGVAA
jgi:hypothetical protein